MMGIERRGYGGRTTGTCEAVASTDRRNVGAPRTSQKGAGPLAGALAETASRVPAFLVNECPPSPPALSHGLTALPNWSPGPTGRWRLRSGQPPLLHQSVEGVSEFMKGESFM